MKHVLRTMILTGCVLLGAQVALSAPAVPGDALPANFTLQTPESRAVNYAAIRGTKGAVLVFVRSLDWCPFCKKQAGEWDAARAAFEKAGYTVATVSYDSPATLTKARARLKLGLATYSDTDSAMIKALGILNHAIEPDNTRLYGIPEPTIYVVNEKGVITHRFAGEGYQVRPDIGLVKKALGIE